MKENPDGAFSEAVRVRHSESDMFYEHYTKISMLWKSTWEFVRTKPAAIKSSHLQLNEILHFETLIVSRVISKSKVDLPNITNWLRLRNVKHAKKGFADSQRAH